MHVYTRNFTLKKKIVVTKADITQDVLYNIISRVTVIQIRCSLYHLNNIKYLSKIYMLQV